MQEFDPAHYTMNVSVMPTWRETKVNEMMRGSVSPR